MPDIFEFRYSQIQGFTNEKVVRFTLRWQLSGTVFFLEEAEISEQCSQICSIYYTFATVSISFMSIFAIPPFRSFLLKTLEESAATVTVTSER